ncbi:helix-turn-helix domain-containing protein [Persicitalea sp.]|uniref:helix-turn-helix domain-containing protein n=1 Tax=Persicitalea sp. TaxID=3100273 RepID=UPI0035940278
MIQVIHRALDLLELIAIEPNQPKALGELADTLGLNHGTCANILKRLVNRGYVEQAAAKESIKKLGVILVKRPY